MRTNILLQAVQSFFILRSLSLHGPDLFAEQRDLAGQLFAEQRVFCRFFRKRGDPAVEILQFMIDAFILALRLIEAVLRLGHIVSDNIETL